MTDTKMRNDGRFNAYVIDDMNVNLKDELGEPFRFERKESSVPKVGVVRRGSVSDVPFESEISDRKWKIGLGIFFSVLFALGTWMGWVRMEKAFFTGLLLTSFCAASTVGMLYVAFSRYHSLIDALLIGAIGPLGVLYIICKLLEGGFDAMPTTLFHFHRDVHGRLWMNGTRWE